MAKTVKLIMVTDTANNNKYYNMFERDNGTFDVEYGRVEANPQKRTYPISKWDSTYRQKTGKGYKDITELYAEIPDDGTVDASFISNDSFVKKLIEDLQRYANNTVTANYTVSSKQVTQKMVDEAQDILDKISAIYKTKYSKEDLNELLLELFKVIPRKMKKVTDHTVNDSMTKDDVSKIIEDEQSILDTMQGQVMVQDSKPKSKDSTKKASVLDSMGIDAAHVTNKAVIEKVKKMMGPSANKFSKLYEIKNHKTDKKYRSLDIENEKLFWHGSRNQNFFNILQTGLLIRPSGAIHTGSMFGDGIYFANKAQKSIGYSSLSGSHWTGGSSDKGYLALFSVNMGSMKDVHNHTYACYDYSEKTIAPYNSVYAHGGADLRNDEFIIYNGNRCTVKYLIEMSH